MNSVLLLALTMVGYLIAYYTYGRYVSRKIFQVTADTLCPSHALRDDVDFVPTHRHLLFGHHFTTISGLGPIVGPAIAIIWGWVPAMLWIFFGSIFLGAVHDFGALVVSLRGQGKSIGQLAGEIVNPRVRTLFLVVICLLLWIVIAVFAFIIAVLFKMYPEAVLPVWTQIPLAIGFGWMVWRRGGNMRRLGIVALVCLYALVWAGTKCPLAMPAFFDVTPLVWWMLLLFVYVYIASILPVNVLLQPRDCINAYQLLVGMALLFAGVLYTHPQLTAPALQASPEGAPSMLPFLFVVIACGAISGFHSVASSGTTSKQCASEMDAQFIGYGSMLVEAILATLAIVAIGGGLGLGLEVEGGGMLHGAEAFSHHYASWGAASKLGPKLAAFINGAANMIEPIGIPRALVMALFGVFMVSFAATTLDSATRIQRYVITELGTSAGLGWFSNKHVATALAVGSAFVLAYPYNGAPVALNLWPLFGTVNQLMGGLALLVLSLYLMRRRVKPWVTAVPMLFMLVATGWALIENMQIYQAKGNWGLLAIAVVITLLEVWMLIESVLVFRTVRREQRAAA